MFEHAYCYHRCSHPLRKSTSQRTKTYKERKLEKRRKKKVEGGPSIEEKGKKKGGKKKKKKKETNNNNKKEEKRRSDPVTDFNRKTLPSSGPGTGHARN